MKIIEGYDLEKKLDKIAKELIASNKEATIITEHVEYVEDVFLRHTNVLFNIEIKTLKNFERDMLVDMHLFNVLTYDKPTLIYKIRQILSKHDFKFFKLSENPYNLIDEIIKALELMHNNGLSYKSTSSNELTLEKLRELQVIDDELMNKDTYFSLEEAILPHIKNNNKNLIVVGDDYTDLNSRCLFTSLDSYKEVTMLLSTSPRGNVEDVFHSFYEGTTYEEAENKPTLSHHLFDIEDVESIAAAYSIKGGNPKSEVTKVTSDIKEKIVKEQAHFSDFMIITPDHIYDDYLRVVFEKWNYRHNIDHEMSFYYDASFKKIDERLETTSAQTFKDIRDELLSLDLTSDYVDLLNSFDSDTKITPFEYRYFLLHILEGTKEAAKKDDAIIVTDFKHALSITSKYVYILGMNEGVTPASVNDSGILLEEDYTSLEKTPLRLIEKLGVNYAEIIRTLMMNKTFIFSYSLGNMDGQELMLSTLMNRCKKIYSLKELRPNALIHTQDLYLKGSTLPDDPINASISHYKTSKNNAEIVDEDYRDMLGKGMSVSRMETYNKCPFQYYLKYGLKVYPQKDNTLQVTELGSLCHYIMEKSLDDVENVETYAREYIEENFKEKYESSLINQYFIDNLIEDMKMNVRIVRRQLDGGSFIPSAYEQEIKGSLGDIPVKGYIDRVDTYEDFFRIIDYKSSAKDINLDLAVQGFNIQMLVYLDLLEKKTEMNPGAVLYYSMKKRIINKAIDPITLHSDFNHEKFYKNFAMKGYVINDEGMKVINASDLDSIPVTLKKDGTPAKKGTRLLSRDDLEKIITRISEYTNELYAKLREGHIEIEPTQSDDNNPVVYPCTFCDYKSVCLYDVFYNSNRTIKTKILNEEKEEN